jgi:hypothetical protein
MDRACSKHGGDEKTQNLKGRNNLGKLDTHGKKEKLVLKNRV